MELVHGQNKIGDVKGRNAIVDVDNNGVVVFWRIGRKHGMSSCYPDQASACEALNRWLAGGSIN